MSVESQPVAGNGKRRRGLIILGLVVVTAGILYTAYWMLVARYYESTDDAYIAGDIVQITSEIPGTVLDVRADDTQTVDHGQALIELDPADARVRVASAEADLARTVREVRGLYSQADQLRSQIAERTTELKQAQDDYHRRQGLLADGAVSGEELAHSRDAITRVKASLEGAHQQLDTTLAQVDGTSIATHPEVLAAAAKYHDAALALHRTTIFAPVSGIVAKRNVQLGQRVAAGTPLMAVVPLDDVWIDANFKEGQLRNVRVGQPVSVHADLYGNDIEYHGKVVGLAAGSGSAFALLPSQNASGNWIKIVQRLPVRIALDAQEIQRYPLRVGLSMRVKINVHDTTGPLVASQVRTTARPSQKSDGDDPAIEARVAEIIQQNSAARGTATARVAPRSKAKHAIAAVAAVKGSRPAVEGAFE